jgi:hypothetical protein
LFDGFESVNNVGINGLIFFYDLDKSGKIISFDKEFKN